MSVYRIGLYRWGFDVCIPATQSRTGQAIRRRKRVLLKGVPEADALLHMHKLAREAEAELRNVGANMPAPRKRRSPSVNVENDQLRLSLHEHKELAASAEGLSIP